MKLAALFAAILPTVAVADVCCFELRSYGGLNAQVEQTMSGGLKLGANARPVQFCLDMEQGRLFDANGRNCILHGPDLKFKCEYDVENEDEFDFRRSGRTTRLIAVNGRTCFQACPAISEDSDKGYDMCIATPDIGDACVPIYLATDSKTSGPGCPSPGELEEAIPQDELDKVMPDQGNEKMDDSTSVTPRGASGEEDQSRDAAFTCKIDPSGPSLAPSAVRVFNEQGQELEMSQQGKAVISPHRKTQFEFFMPDYWVPEETTLCAIQFRFPPCNELPRDYPCFEWTGMEHDTLAEAGMHWNLVSSSVHDWSPSPWWFAMSSPFQLTTPETNKTVGVFGCRHDKSERADTFMASSVNHFALRFLQAGPESQFEDGVGAFVVPCVPEN